MPSITATQPLRNGSLAELAEQCVKCGLCLVHCPTYRVMGVEGESPRGRIAYASALDLRLTGATPPLRTQLDDCLACGTCEVVCPTQVRFDDILVGTRAAIGAERDESRLTRTVRRWAQRRWLWRGMQHLRLLPLHLLARLIPGSARLAAMFPALPRPVRVPHVLTPPDGGTLGKVTLFRGCVASALDSDTHAAAAKVLAAIGYEVESPSAAHCCGALDRHAGDVARAARLAAAAARTCNVGNGATLVGSATGCHRDVVAHVDRNAVDVLALVSQHRARLPKLSPRTLRVAWLAPCTQVHAAPPAAVQELVSRIDGVAWTSLPLQPRCCGAAGVYFIDHAHISDPLRAERVEQIAAMQPDVVLTTNIGCRLHLRAGLLDAGLDVPVIHPIMLIADALP